MLHVVAQTNRGTRSLFLSGGCGSVAAQKACGFHPGSLSLSHSLSSLFLFLQPFFLYVSFSLCLFIVHSHPVRGPPPFSLPFRHGGPSLVFFSSRYASFYATAQPRSVPVSRPLLSSSDARDLPASLFSPFRIVLHPPLLLPNSTTSVAFSLILSVLPFLSDVQTDRARE